MKKARKCVGAKVCLLPSLTRLDNQRENGHHLIVGLKGSKESFIVPLPLVLMTFEDRVCKPGTYQVYEHTLIRKTGTGLVTTENYMDGAGQYVGITSRTWQQRAKEHAHAARRGSYLSGQQQVSDHKNQTYTSSQSSPECAPHRPPALWPFCT